MSESSDKTEQPTAKRLRDARRDGDVPKSQDLNHTVTTLVWTLLLAGLSGFAADRIGSLLDFSWTQTDLSSATALRDVGIAALKTFALLTIVPLAIVALSAACVEFLQVGALFAPKRITPQGSRLNPANGFKRMFSSENFFELAKALLKTLLLAAMLAWLMKHYMPDIMRLPAAGLQAYVGLDRRMLLVLGASIVVLFAFVSIADRLFQNYRNCAGNASDCTDSGPHRMRVRQLATPRRWS